MEKKLARKNSQMTGEIKRVAKTKKTVAIVPVILEVAEIEAPIAVRVLIHVRHPVVAIGILPNYTLYAAHFH